MADFIDETEEREQFKLDATIANIRKKAEVSIQGDGSCLECESPVRPVKVGDKVITPRWCSTECRDRWEINQ
jgi:co-chaperonin GroES (HSP10)